MILKRFHDLHRQASIAKRVCYVSVHAGCFRRPVVKLSVLWGVASCLLLARLHHKCSSCSQLHSKTVKWTCSLPSVVGGCLHDSVLSARSGTLLCIAMQARSSPQHPGMLLKPEVISGLACQHSSSTRHNIARKPGSPRPVRGRTQRVVLHAAQA